MQMFLLIIKDLLLCERLIRLFGWVSRDGSQALRVFAVAGSNVIAFRLKGHANGDACQDLIVILNARTQMTKVTVPLLNILFSVKMVL
jgi:hypothetical protein